MGNRGTFRTGGALEKVFPALTGTSHAYMQHGRGRAPAYVRWTLVCLTADLAYSPGDEVDVTGATQSTDVVAFATGGGASELWLWQYATPYTAHKLTGAFSAMTQIRWAPKVYAEWR